jgi:MFS family permease
MENTESTQKQLEGNLKLFILFRLFYTARFYYPVFAVLFLDYGLSLEQFAILNLIWALTIVIAEVPSGALADIIGRKRLVVFAALMMVVEMVLIVFAPIGASDLLFLMFVGNRICSGLSEAAASGADEALAYDSLKALGREDEWAKLLEKTTFVVSIGFFTTMILGAFAYDPDVVNWVLGRINSDWVVADNIVIRLPVILTLITACIVLITALRFYDLDAVRKRSQRAVNFTFNSSLRDPFRQILLAAKWTLNHRFVLFVILAGLSLDSVGRQFAVLASEYYRVIDIPISWFGFIGAAMALIGIVNARISRYLVSHRSPFFNFIALSCVLMIGLVGISFAVPIMGMLFAIGAFAMMGMVQFQTSYYINREVDSGIRATVLSFRGMALNLGLGIASLLYTGYVSMLRARQQGNFSTEEQDAEVFVDALLAFPIYYLSLFLAVILLAQIFVKHRDVFFNVPPIIKPSNGNHLG